MENQLQGIDSNESVHIVNISGMNICCLPMIISGRGPEATSKLFMPESEVDILENLIGRT